MGKTGHFLNISVCTLRAIPIILEILLLSVMLLSSLLLLCYCYCCYCIIVIVIVLSCVMVIVIVSSRGIEDVVLSVENRGHQLGKFSFHQPMHFKLGQDVDL